MGACLAQQVTYGYVPIQSLSARVYSLELCPCSEVYYLLYKTIQCDLIILLVRLSLPNSHFSLVVVLLFGASYCIVMKFVSIELGGCVLLLGNNCSVKPYSHCNIQPLPHYLFGITNSHGSSVLFLHNFLLL